MRRFVDAAALAFALFVCTSSNGFPGDDVSKQAKEFADAKQAKELTDVAAVAAAHGDFAVAEEKLAKAVALMPANAALLYNLALVQERLGKYSESFTSIDRALNIGLPPETVRAAEKLKAELTYNLEKADPIIISTATFVIRKSELESAMKTLPSEYQQYAAGPGRKQFADDYLRMRILAAEGKKNGVDTNPEVIRQFSAATENLVAQEELKKLKNGITVSDAEINAMYAERKNEYGQSSLEAVKPKIEERIRDAKLREMLDALLANSKPSFDPTYFSATGATTQKNQAQ